MTVIAVLGCGPAGLIAAQSAAHLGARVHVCSIPKPSYIAGAQYLHSAVPGVTSENPDGYIDMLRVGTRDGYATKVYGYPQAPVSWDRYSDTVYPAWNMRAIYASLWRRWEPALVPMQVTPDIVARAASGGVLGGAADGWGGLRVDGIISTVPLKALCRELHAPTPHVFLDQDVYIRQIENSDGVPTRGQNQITYNGESSPAWYRHSHIFGCEAFEYSALGKRPPLEGIVKISKPLASDCTCLATAEGAIPLALMGRYGTWNKNGLVHAVPAMVQSFMEGVG